MRRTHRYHLIAVTASTLGLALAACGPQPEEPQGVSAIESALTVGGYYCPQTGDTAVSTIPANNEYYLTSFEGGTMACGGQADGVSLYVADKQRFGCGASLRVTNPMNGKSCVASVDDYGPNVCVEEAAGMPIIDASPAIAEFLFGSGSAGWSDRLRIVATVTSDPIGCGTAPAGTSSGSGSAPALPASLDQVENNSSLSALTWADGHIELFARTNSSRAIHVWTKQETDNWNSPTEFAGAAECGVASVMSYAGEEHAELFDPDSAGQTQSLYFLDGWHDFSDFDGRGMTQLTTLRWSDTKAGGWTDGRTEVFAHGNDNRIWHKYYDPISKSWNGWDSLGGQFVTGVSAILNHAGDGMLFATDHDGQAWYDESSKATGEGWQGWKPMGGHLSSRPVVVREGGGTLRVFARGQDGTLYGAHSTEAGFSPFQVIHSNFQLVGEPSASIDDGVVTVFVRGLSGYVSFVTMDPKTHVFGKYTRRGETKFGADPFGWQRPDGRVELFSITSHGFLMSSYHSKAGWTAWRQLASGIDSCPAVAVGCPNGDGTYCGGHGVGGTAGNLYTCTDGMLALDERCSASCHDDGNGGQDACAQPTGCTQNSDCVASMGQYAVCVMPTLYCTDPGTQPNYCSTDIQATQDQPCTTNAECDPAGTGTMTCGACVGSCGATNCCEYSGG